MNIVEGLVLSNEVLAALIGSATAAVTMLLTQLLIVRKQHVRTHRANLLQQRLANAYAPLDYHLSVLADLEAGEEAQHSAWEVLRVILSSHGFLLSRQLRSDLYRLTQSGQPEQLAAQIFMAFRQEYNELADIYYEVHLLPQARRRNDPVTRSLLTPYRWVKESLGRATADETVL